MPDVWTAIAALSLLIWLYLALFHGRYWRADQRLERELPAPRSWPAVAVAVPARDEADVVGPAVATLVAQDYPGRFHVVLVDDRSADGTAETARRAAADAGHPQRLDVIEGQPLAAGWSGKLWALSQGVAAARAALPEAEYVLLTDADIAHAPDNLRRLVAKAERDGLDLVSLMVLLHCRSAVERLFIPAFVYFFQQLYPFPDANTPGRATAAAAGGCILVRGTALERVGGLEAIRGELIDDCALAARIKRNGAIWIGLTEKTRSLRPYAGLGDIWRMVARTAYTQLRHSPVRLAGTVLGLLATYLAPPVVVAAALAGIATAQAGIFGGLAWLLMAATYGPTLRLYRQPMWLAPLLPAIAVVYTAMTVDFGAPSLAGHRRRVEGPDLFRHGPVVRAER